MKNNMSIYLYILFVALLFIACANSSLEKESFIIVETSGPFFNAEDVNVLAQRIVEIKDGSSEYLIVDNSGRNITKKLIDDFPDKEKKIKNYLIEHWEEKNLSELPVESFRIVEKDKYRVTNWKKEIDEFYKGERFISQITRDKDDMLTNPPPEDEIREKFLSEIEVFYKEKDYEKIINHIKTNEYIIYSLEDIKGLQDLSY